MSFNTNCTIIAVVGGKGGTGKSVFAANFAIKIGMELKTPTLLIDADQKSCGDQNFITGLTDPKTLDQLCNFNGSIIAKNLPQICAIHPKAPLHYIAAVKGPGQILSVSSAIVIKQLAQLSHLYKFIVIDLGNDFDDLQNKLLEISSAVLVVTTPEILTINQTLRVINELRSATIPFDMIQIVLNKASSLGIAPQSIEQSLRKPLLGVIPQDDITTSAALKRSEPFMISAPQTPIANAYTEILRKLTGGILQNLKNLNRTQKSAFDKTEPSAPGTEKKDEVSPRTHLKMLIHRRLIKEFESMNKNIEEEIKDPEKKKKLESDVRLAIAKIMEQEGSGLSTSDRKQITEEVLDEALGLGPLEALLADKDISEIMVNGFGNIFFEKKGLINRSSITFTANQQLHNIIQRIVMPLGRQINSKTPFVDARLPDGSRVHAIIEPLAIDGPALTIRKFKKDAFGEEQYIQYGSSTRQMMVFLKLAVEYGCNIIISGGTGSGKTTLLNCMSSFIPSKERIITVEDAAELQLRQQHVVRLETRPANSEGAPAVTIRDLVRNTLRMRPDRIVVGECRDGAALDMLAAMSTGHDGSMTTVHANNPREAVSRLETLCLMAGMDLPVRAIREQIASAVDIIVQISRLSDGTRKIIDISEIQGLQGDTVTILPVFQFKETGINPKTDKIEGQYYSEGLIPKFIEELRQKGVEIPTDIFSNDDPKNAPGNSPAPVKNNVAKPSFSVKKVPGGSGTGTGGKT
ncbi:MAG: Flp pilus assembly complex ATPase component TadA [Bdellovibrionales bacterium]|nr:Flp pilus assembly complex ATPase component TadA [Bdellovibrionales bacterium]